MQLAPARSSILLQAKAEKVEEANAKVAAKALVVAFVFLSLGSGCGASMCELCRTAKAEAKAKAKAKAKGKAKAAPKAKPKAKSKAKEAPKAKAKAKAKIKGEPNEDPRVMCADLWVGTKGSRIISEAAWRQPLLFSHAVRQDEQPLSDLLKAGTFLPQQRQVVQVVLWPIGPIHLVVLRPLSRFVVGVFPLTFVQSPCIGSHAGHFEWGSHSHTGRGQQVSAFSSGIHNKFSTNRNMNRQSFVPWDLERKLQG